MVTKPKFIHFFIFLLLVAVVVFVYLNTSQKNQEFNPKRAMNDVQAQIELGPRTPGSEAHAAVIKYIANNLRKAGWEVELQKTKSMGHPITNIIARQGTGSEVVIIGAHYDSRLVADSDPDPELAKLPVAGANDGASGVAVLLELARILPADLDKQVWLVFFDAEDQGNLPGWDWILGSRAFVDKLEVEPSAVVVIDMIGDSQLKIFREKSSDPALTDEIWTVAADIGYENKFINKTKYSILDDHVPFLEAGFPAIDIIDFDYPHWHTAADTIDKVSGNSLKVVGTTLYEWLTR